MLQAASTDASSHAPSIKSGSIPVKIGHAQGSASKFNTADHRFEAPAKGFRKKRSNSTIKIAKTFKKTNELEPNPKVVKTAG